MKVKHKPRFIEIRDRKLGDEWTDWKGHLEIIETNANTGKRTFLGLLLLTIVVTGIVGFLIWYMIVPRLFQFHQLAPLIIGLGMLFVWTFLTIWFTLMVLSIITEKDLLFRFKNREFSIQFPIQMAWNLGRKIGWAIVL